MKRPGLILMALVVSGTISFAGNAKLDSMLRRLDPETRFEQVCDMEAMQRIDKDANPFHPDRAVVNAVSPPTVNEQTMHGSGGAFRSGGRWYQFSFTCRTSSDNMKVLEFRYEIGAMIPEQKWDTYGLWR